MTFQTGEEATLASLQYVSRVIGHFVSYKVPGLALYLAVFYGIAEVKPISISNINITRSSLCLN